MKHSADIQRYYRYHAPVYDASRWSFLFGRKTLIRRLPDLPRRPHILEVGCGTGHNLQRLRREYPEARLTGLDLSRAMLRKAARKMQGDPRTRLIKGSYGWKRPPISQWPLSQGPQEEKETNNGSRGDSHKSAGRNGAVRFDLILLSYSLTIRSNQADRLLNCVCGDLNPAGYIAVVDFHATPSRSFQKWMHINNVIMDGSLLPLLRHYFRPQYTNIRQAYFGLWSYFKYIGQKPGNIKDN